MFQLPFSKYVDYKSSHEIKESKYGPALLSAVSIWTMSAFLNICNHILSTTKLVLWEMANTKRCNLVKTHHELDIASTKMDINVLLKYQDTYIRACFKKVRAYLTNIDNVTYKISYFDTIY